VQRLKNISILVGVLTLQGCDYFDVQAGVECSQIAGGLSCVVERQKGTRQVQACWSTAFVCENGIKMQHDMCSSVPPAIGDKATKITAWQEISNYNDCDKISAMSVENVVLK
jgi:hypothetical protein